MPNKLTRQQVEMRDALRDLKAIVRLIEQRRLGGRPIEGSEGMAWRLWNLVLPMTTLDLYLTKGTIVMRGQLRAKGSGLAFALDLLGVARDE